MSLIIALFLSWMNPNPVTVVGPATSAIGDASSETGDDWIDLLAKSGPELRGWTRLPMPAGGKLNPKNQWSIDPRTGWLVCDGTAGHDWLRWDEEFTDCAFLVEWRFTPVQGPPRYNSGVYIRNNADGSIWHQAQTGGGSGGFLFGDSPVKGTVQRVNLSKSLKEQRVKPAGEWNTFELRCQGPKITLRVNGEITSEWPDCEVLNGHVGLEAEGYRIEFRKIMVKRLSE